MARKRQPIDDRPIPLEYDHVWVAGAFWHRVIIDGEKTQYWWKTQRDPSKDSDLRKQGVIHPVFIGTEEI